jgi:8-oxo-dGTP diphosphatase
MTAADKKAATENLLVAAGGIVLRGKKKPLIAVVQLRGQKVWVLPKGKLHKDETTLAAARREAIEETGRDVLVYEYLGQIAYRSGGQPKVAKFWRMEARGKPLKLMRDVQAVQWLPLAKAIAKLSRPREQKFLRRVGPRAVQMAMPGDTRRPAFARLINWVRRGLSRRR